MPVPSGGLLDANPGVDRLVRNPPPPIAREVAARAAGDLVGQPSLRQTVGDVTPHFRPLHLGRPGALAPPPLGLPLGGDRPVAAAAAVASKFSGDRAIAVAQPVGDLRLKFSGPVHVGYDLAFFEGKTTCDRGDSFFSVDLP
jgi:hypothetical protein